MRPLMQAITGSRSVAGGRALWGPGVEVHNAGPKGDHKELVVISASPSRAPAVMSSDPSESDLVHRLNPSHG